MAWQNDLGKSMDAFKRLIQPELEDVMKGRYIPVEGRPEEIAELLDMRMGIDAMVESKDVFYGLASRIQIDSGVWNTFTIRSRRESGNTTELEKLRRAIKHDTLRPQITVQAYVENDKLKTMGLARTKDIVEYIDTHDCDGRTSNDGRKVQFKIVPWDKMREAGYKVIVIDHR